MEAPTVIQRSKAIEVVPAIEGSGLRVLTKEALAFIEELHRTFEPRRREVLAAREARQKDIDQGKLPSFLPETESVRKGDWKVAPIPKDLLDRRVEITGPV
ncbi:MAG TPA: malate synthase A, partial [Planctomycetota bacterium]|nr:malate synthase A [Planctomycetota bacterium]